MNSKHGRNQARQPKQGTGADKDIGKLEKLAHVIDPPGKETSDDQLIDPGKHTPGSPAPRVTTPGGRKSSGTR